MILNHDCSFIGNNSVDDACKIFTDTLLNFLNLCIPNKEVTIRLNDKPWYDSEIRILSRKHDRQKAIVVSLKNANDWLKYKQYRNKVNNMKKHAKKVYYNNIEDVISESHTHNPKLYWKLLKQLVKSNTNAETIPPLKVSTDHGEDYYFTDEEKANCLNDFLFLFQRIIILVLYYLHLPQRQMRK